MIIYKQRPVVNSRVFKMFALGLYGWTVSVISSFLIGVSKTGIPGSGILAVPLMADILPARSSTGAVLILLIFADVFAVAYYKRHAVWHHLLRIMPYTAVGIVIGYFALGRVSDSQLQPAIGAIVLIMLVLGYWRDKNPHRLTELHTKKGFGITLGLIAGVTTMMANAAGPILIIYLIAMKLPKKQFIGTSAWYFMILNWVKVPFSAHLGLITAESLKFNLALLPAVAFGAAAGIFILKKLPQKTFHAAVQILAAISALRLLLG
jgi:uncharacterized protein